VKSKTARTHNRQRNLEIIPLAIAARFGNGAALRPGSLLTTPWS
jgi:hypothetical protein